MARTIQCADCGADYTTDRDNALYCAVCRLFRDVRFQGNRKSKCIMCETSFSKTMRNQPLCPNCDPLVSRLHGHGECAFCHHTSTLIRKEVAVCLGCAHDPELRTAFMRALANKIQRTKHPEAV